MTPEEIQTQIEGLLAVQRGLQEGQLEANSKLDRLRHTTEGLIRLSENVLETSTKHSGAIDRLVSVAQQQQEAMRQQQEAMRQQQESNAQLKRAVDYLMSQDGQS